MSRSGEDPPSSERTHVVRRSILTEDERAKQVALGEIVAVFDAREATARAAGQHGADVFLLYEFSGPERATRLQAYLRRVEAVGVRYELKEAAAQVFDVLRKRGRYRFSTRVEQKDELASVHLFASWTD